MKALTTLGHIPTEHLNAMVTALDATIPQHSGDMVKHETGDQHDQEGHLITFEYKNKTIFWAMIHSSQSGYLVRSVPGLLSRAS